MAILDARIGGDAAATASKKRPRDEEDVSKSTHEGTAGATKKDQKKQKKAKVTDESDSSKPKKTKKKNGKKGAQSMSSKQRTKERQDVSLEESGGSVHAWFQHRYETDGSKLSKLELYPGVQPYVEADFWSMESCSKTLGNLKKHLDSKKKSTVLIITRSAVRACEMLKNLSSLQRPVGKLFAKHMKLEEQVKYLQGPGSKLDAAIGTPNRILKLAETGALAKFLQNPEGIILFDLDRDVKNYHVLTMPAVSSDTFLLLRKCYLPQKSGSRAKLAMFGEPDEI